LADEVADDSVELLAEVDGLKWNPESGRNHARVARVSDRAAGLPARFLVRDVNTVAHEEPDEGEALERASKPRPSCRRRRSWRRRRAASRSAVGDQSWKRGRGWWPRSGETS